VSSIVRRFDLDGDGEVDYEEFACGLIAETKEERKSFHEEATSAVKTKAQAAMPVKRVPSGPRQVKEVIAPVQEFVAPPPANPITSKRGSGGNGEKAARRRSSAMNMKIENRVGFDIQEEVGGVGATATVIDGLGGIRLPDRDSYSEKKAMKMEAEKAAAEAERVEAERAEAERAEAERAAEGRAEAERAAEGRAV
jgi:hypothetical protein